MAEIEQKPINFESKALGLAAYCLSAIIQDRVVEPAKDLFASRGTAVNDLLLASSSSHIRQADAYDALYNDTV